MIRIRLTALFFVVALLMIGHNVNHLIWAQGDPTVTPNINWVHSEVGINVRSGPGYTYDTIGQLPVGVWVQPLGRSLDGEWILITYLYTQGWVQRDGVSWRLNTAALPLIREAEPTPISPPLYYNTPGGPTYTPNANWVQVGVEGAYVRSGPGKGYPRVGELFTGDVVDPVAHDQSVDWVLIRFGDGYGWIRYDLVRWIVPIDPLPVVDAPELTPSFTAVPPNPTSTATPTATETNTPSLTPSVTQTPTPTYTASPTASTTATPSNTPTLTPSATLTDTSTVTASPVPTQTFTEPAPSPTETASATPVTLIVEPVSPTFTPSPTATIVTPTATFTSTSTATFTSTPTATATPQAVAAANTTEGNGGVLSSGPESSLPPSVILPPSQKRSRSPLPYVMFGGGLGLVVLAYLSAYAMQNASMRRYQEGFILWTCPICQEGHLSLDERRYRMLGIPRIRRVVRCDTCRSVLREVGRQRWRYAVDATENPELYDELNGRVLTDDRLLEISPEYQTSRLQYIEGDEDQ